MEGSEIMILHLSGIRMPIEDGEKMLPERIAVMLALPMAEISLLTVLRRSLDARRRRPPFFVYEVEVSIPDGVGLPDAVEGGVSIKAVEKSEPAVSANGVWGKEKHLSRARISKATGGQKVIVVGCGPAGLFAALHLSERGVPVLLLERGKAVYERCSDVQAFWERGMLDRESNVHFGEGGAGTFSDGKLTSRTKNPLVRRVKETFVALGAEPNILIDAKPHIGTDKLREVVVNFRARLLSLGCEIRFGSTVSDFVVKKGRLAGVVVNGREDIKTDCLILAPGQNADDTYEKLRERDVQLAPKPFALGLRVEHPQKLINEMQYGKWHGHPALPPADYFVTAKVGKGDRSVYTFCMCPGGRIIGCASEPGRVITNGMSNALRDGSHANSAVVVNVRADDFLGTLQAPLRGLTFRKEWEEKAFRLGGGDYRAPAQRLLDFLQDKQDGGRVDAGFLPGVKAVFLRDVLPAFATEALKEGLRLFDGKMPGFTAEEAVLIGVETRTSSPVRILRDANGESVNTKGLYPCGEGAGYAGGIVSSAIDGIRAAEGVLDSRGIDV